MEQKSNKRKVIISFLIVITSLILAGIVFASTSIIDKNHYAVDVVKESAISKDENIQITEKIVKEAGQKDFDSKELNYEVELKNINQADKNTEIAFLIDSSWSMGINDPTNVGRTKTKEIATKLMTEVKDASFSVSSNSRVYQWLNPYVGNVVNIDYTDRNQTATCSQGLDYAYSTFSKKPGTNDGAENVNRFMIILTDGTDDISEKVKELKDKDSNLQIFILLVDITSSTFIDNGEPIADMIYLIQTDPNATNTVSNIPILDSQKIYDEIDKKMKKFTVTNKFLNIVVEYFDITDYSVTAGEISTTDTGYTWTVDEIGTKDTQKLTFKLKLKEKEVNAGLIFEELATNEEQNVTYFKYDDANVKNIKGTDGREGTDATVIRICQGYDIKIKAINASNKELPVQGVEFTVIGTQKVGSETVEVCNTKKTTNSSGYIIITPEDAKSLRIDGRITYTIIPTVKNLLGYTETKSVSFDVTNSRITRKLSVDDYNDIGIPPVDETNRLIEVTIPINTQKVDFEVRNEELNNANTTLAGSKFVLSQPLLNDKYKMEKLEGVTDENGIIHFSPTVMTKDGTYTYYLEQEEVSSSYNKMEMVRIDVTFEKGLITKVIRLYNTNVDVSLIASDHVLVTTRNECVMTDPFNLTINLKDEDTSNGVGPVTYLVKTIYSNGTSRAEYVQTNEKTGSIETKIYANGQFQIEITEQSTKAGYEPNTVTTVITASRANNEVTVWNVDTNKAVVKLDPNKENVIVNLTTKKKLEQNIVRISLVDADETDISVGKDVAYTLTDNETGLVYGPAISDKTGNLAFTIDNKPQGLHEFTLKADKTTVPNDYNEESVADSIRMNISYDEYGYIDGTSNIIDDRTVVESHYSTISNSNSVEYTYFITIGYTLNYDNTAIFKVQLSDKDNINRGLAEAKYNIEIKWTVNGVERTKTIKERKTNGYGQISTRITKADDVQITVQEVGSSIGYVCDGTTQEIGLNFLQDGRIKIEQTPYDKGTTNTDEPNQGVAVEDGYVQLNSANEIVYWHLNKRRSTQDTYINLTVNKIDKSSESYVNGVILGISSDLESAIIPGTPGSSSTPQAPSQTLLDEKGQNLDLIMTTGHNGSDGTVSIDYKQYILDKINNHTIQVPGIGTNGNEMVFNMVISELEKTGSGGYKTKDGSTVKLRLIFRYRDGEVKLTNVESYYGNNLVKDKTFSSTGDDELGVYLADITLDLWTNYAEVGNLSLDFKKQDTNEKQLDKAYYDVRVVNPDGSVLKKQNIEIKNGDLSADVELQGLAVNVDSIIEITEKQAPIGYGINETETLRVKRIAEDGEIELEHIDSSYQTKRLKLEKISATTTTSGKLKTNYQVTLIDYALDTFIFGIQGVDSETLEGVGDYSFSVKSDLAALKTISTGNDGKGQSKVGAMVDSKTVTYTITPKNAAPYYKLPRVSYNVRVVFDSSGHVDLDATMKAQTDWYYGRTWNITKLETYGEIEIQILLEHQAPLSVQVETRDRITNAVISDVDYKVSESIKLPATGTGYIPTIQVGYALEEGIKTYKLEETRIKYSYTGISDKVFQIQYANGIITDAKITHDNDTDATITKIGNLAVKIVVYAEPKVPFEISNLYYFDKNIALQGVNFEITSLTNEEIATGTTNARGTVGIYCDISGKESEKIYKIRQTSAAIGYATVDDFYIKVHYTADKTIDSVKLTNRNGDEVESRFVEVGFRVSTTEYNCNNKGIPTIKVFNYPEFKINIEDVDRRNNNKIVGTVYSVTSTYQASDNSTVNFTSASDVTTDTNGIGIAHLDKTRDDTIVTYKIKEDRPAIGYQSYGSDLDIYVTYDENGYVQDATFQDRTKVNGLATITLPTITESSDPTEKFVVNIQLKNNPLLKFNLTTMDSVDNTIKIKDIGFQITSKTSNGTLYSNSSATNSVNQTTTPQTSYTDKEGYTASYLDRTLENTVMYYTIKEVKKSPGYEWIDQDIIVAVSYDENGKISTASVTQGAGSIKYDADTWLDSENFEITLDIFNDEIKQFGIHIATTDVYDKDKRLNDMEVDAYLVDQGKDNTSYSSDGKFELVGENSLKTGADRDGDNLPDITYGEDYKTVGAYDGGAGTRTLRLHVKTPSQNGYYVKDNKNIGYYKGSNYTSEGIYYQTVGYNYLIDVTFDDNGKITDARLRTGHNQHIGWLANGDYVQVGDGQAIEHTDYKLNITLKFFPMFNLNAFAMDNYKYTDQTNLGQDPKKLDNASFTVSTSRHYNNPRADEYVTAGYIGDGHIMGTSTIMGSIYSSSNSLYVPIERNKTRLFYIFEDNEPTHYQTMHPRKTVDMKYNRRLVAIVKVEFDEFGEIVEREHVYRPLDDTQVLPPFMNEDGSYLSNSNLKEYNYHVTGHSTNRDMDFYIGYALTTTITVTAVDDISARPISNIRMYPFVNNTEVSNMPYTYDSTEKYYRNTNGSGQATWKYWGAAIKDATNSYTIGSARETLSKEKYNGYLFPSDMASTQLGGSGNAEDYYAKLDVTIGEDGRISNVTSTGHDLWGDDNISKKITWDSETGHVNIIMLYSRKFQLVVNKSDFYDSTINNLSASFDIISNKGLRTTINSMQMAPLGKVYKNATVKYTLSETMAPAGYYPLEKTVNFYVTFDEDGNIGLRSIKTDDPDYVETISTSESTDKTNKTSPDLTISVKNKPAFVLDLRVIDKFYQKDGIKDIYFNITNSKGNTATGNPQTDTRGYANSIIMGPIYPNEEVIYYITQRNKAPDYYANYTTIQLHVKYNQAGRIENYWIQRGGEIVNNFETEKFKNTKKISMEIMNMPETLNIGLYKYNELTNEPMGAVPFKITKQDVTTMNKIDLGTIITESNGAVIQRIDTFNTSYSGKVIKYTIHEEEVPQTFRRMEDVVFLIRYNADGSMSSCNQIANERGILNTKVKLDMATDGNIRYLNDQRVHFKVTVPNNNTFDIQIKNEDTNCEKLGIEGSKFDLRIDDTQYELPATDEKGETGIQNLTQAGELTINIAQREVGEGYKQDIDNHITINLEKGVTEYTLDLLPNQDGYIDDKNAQTTKAIVEVNEDYGLITITFKNETKTELTILKQDINTAVSLENAIFDVTAVQVDSNGEPVNINPDPDGEKIENTKTLGENKVTNSEGKIHFELGVAPINEIWKYTFTEKTPPEGYNKILPVSMTVTFDQNGRIAKLETNKESRLTPIMATNYYNCHSIYAIIKNGDISPAYKVKVITEDAQTRKRINGSQIYMNITNNETGEQLVINPSSSSAQNGSTSETANLGINGQKYTDAQLASAPLIAEKGITYIDNIDFEGTINIELSQRQTAYGYIFGSHRTDTNNGIKIKATYEPQEDDDPIVKFEKIDVDGFGDAVSVDEKNRVITIKLLNESSVKFNITTQTYGKSPIPIQGASYNITSEMFTATETIKTDLNETTQLSDEEGKIVANAGNAVAGKTVIYKLHQIIPSAYQSIDDIQIEVKYDASGYIKYIEPLSSEDNIRIDYDKTQGSRDIYLNVYNRKFIGDYKVLIEKHALDTDEDENAYGILLPGAKYQIIVNQEDSGAQTVEWTAITDDNGLIEMPYTLNGFGYITVTIKELEAPEGYKLDDVKTLKLYRNKETGEFEQVDGNINFECNSDNTQVYLKPIDAQLSNKYTLVINKYSTLSQKRITDNQARFKAELVKKDELGNITYHNEIQNIYTDKTGKATMDNITMPDEGDYTLIVTETEPPKGYQKLEKPIELGVTFSKIDEDKVIISSINAEGLENATISTFKDQLIGINVNNDVDLGLKEDEYSLDITKVDSTTMQGIEDMAVFKVWLPDENKTAVYTETTTTLLGPGKLDYCYIEQDKDYTMRLTHMKKPTIEQIKEAEGQKVVHTYTFQEAVAPDGYALDTTLLNLEIEFIIRQKEDGTEEIIISRAQTSDGDKFKLNSVKEQAVSADILNKEQANEFRVEYDSNTEDEVTNLPSEQIKQAGMPLTLAANIPVREGFTFKEWNTAQDGSGSSFKPTDTYALDADVRLYAIWEVAKYNIHYEANAPIDPNTGVEIGLVSNMPEDQIKTHGIDITLDDDEKTPTIPNVSKYYEFAGWNIASDGTGTHYDEKDIYSLNEDIKLYAEWNYIINYDSNIPKDSNGFSISQGAPKDIPENQKENVNSKTNIIIDDLNVYKNAPTLEGYKFIEWNTKADGTGQKYNPNDEYTKRQGMDLYAIWKYEVIYNENKPLDKNGFPIEAKISNMPASPQIQDVDSIAIIANKKDNPNVPTMDPNDYIFVEWNTKPDGTGDSYKADDEYSGKIGITLYAIWEDSNKLYLKSTQYIIGNEKPKGYVEGDETKYKEGDKYILGIMPKITVAKPSDESEKNKGTTITEFISNIKTNADTIELYDASGTLVTDQNALVFTGETLKLIKDKEQISIILVVRGDYHDGSLKLNDYNQLGNYLSKGISSVLNTEARMKAMDVNLDGRVNLRDYNFMASALSKSDNTELK